MPQNWKTYKLGEIATLQRGFDLPTQDRVDGSIPIIAASGIGGYHNVYKVKGPGVITGRSGTIGKVMFEKDNFWPLNTSLWVKDFHNNDPKYIYYLLTQFDFSSFNNGTSVPTLNRNDVHSVELSIPPLPEQHAIASILSSLDDKIELNLQMNKTLEEMAMTLYKHWFVDFEFSPPFQGGVPEGGGGLKAGYKSSGGKFIDSELGPIPEGWEVKRLDSLVKFSNGYAFKSSQLLKDEEEDCLHVFKMGHIQKGGGLKPNGTKSWIKRSDCSRLDKYILKVGDILMSMTDMKDNMTILGHTALMNENGKYIVNQRVGLLRANNDMDIGYPFIYILTNSTDYIERLRSQANSGVQVNLSTDAIKSSLVITPTKEINGQFNSIVLPFFEQISQNAIENQTLTILRDTLLPKLISGEVRVKDAEQTLSEVL